MLNINAVGFARHQYILYNIEMSFEGRLIQVDYSNRYSGMMSPVGPTGNDDSSFLAFSQYDNSSKQVDRIQNCLAVCLINHSDAKSQLLHVSPRPGMVRSGYIQSSNVNQYYSDKISVATRNFSRSRGLKSVSVLGGVDTDDRLCFDLGSPKVTRHDIFELTLSEVRRAIPDSVVEVGPSNKSNSCMFWVGLIALQNDFQIQYINTLAMNRIAPDDF